MTSATVTSHPDSSPSSFKLFFRFGLVASSMDLTVDMYSVLGLPRNIILKLYLSRQVWDECRLSLGHVSDRFGTIF